MYHARIRLVIIAVPIIQVQINHSTGWDVLVVENSVFIRNIDNKLHQHIAINIAFNRLNVTILLFVTCLPMDIWNEQCDLYMLFELLWKKRIIMIIFLLGDWVEHFNEMLRKIPKLNSKVLSAKLKDLIAWWVIRKQVSLDGTMRITYSLTKKWQALAHHIQQFKSDIATY